MYVFNALVGSHRSAKADDDTHPRAFILFDSGGCYTRTKCYMFMTLYNLFSKSTNKETYLKKEVVKDLFPISCDFISQQL